MYTVRSKTNPKKKEILYQNRIQEGTPHLPLTLRQSKTTLSLLKYVTYLTKIQFYINNPVVIFYSENETKERKIRPL